jgi:hypothetical protein
MLSSQPLAEISLWKQDRERFLNLLFECTVASGLSAVIVTRTHGSVYDTIHVTHHNAAHLYHLQSADNIPAAVELICTTKPWHRGSFCIILGESSLVDSLKKHPHFITAPVPAIEKFVRDRICGYTFPLDDALVFYGDDDIQKMITGIMQEFRSD